MKTQEDTDFYNRLTNSAHRQQDAFLSGIAARFGRTPMTDPPKHPFRGAPDYWQSFQPDIEHRIQLFMDNWKMAGGAAEQLADWSEAKRFIVDLGRQMEARHILYQDQDELNDMEFEKAFADGQAVRWNGSDPERMNTIAVGADFGIVVADYAVSVSGSVVALSNTHKGRITSLLPTVCIFCIHSETLKSRLGEVMAEIEAMPAGEMPAGIHFISGPSRSADIENDLTIGVHGPGIVYALIIG